MARCHGSNSLDARDLRELTIFMTVGRDLSFRAAARRLSLAPSAVSRVVQQLESRLGVRLLNRTTRSVALTPAGEQLLGRLPPLLDALDDVLADVVATSSVPSGTVRLNLPRIAATLLLPTLLEPFAAAFPRIAIDLTIDDGLSDIVARGHDAGVRVGGRLAQDMAAVRLTPDLHNAIVATRRYFEARPRPTRPQDLLDHRCLNYRWRPSEELYRWQFAEEGRAVALSIDAGLTVDDTGILLEAALAGMGVACLPDLLVAPLIAAGRLERVLEGFCPAQPGFFLYYPLNGHPSAALGAFIAFVRRSAET